MRRTYNRERYLDRVALIREHVPDCALTTDIIVGFPGETEDDFERTLEVVEQVGYDGAFTFVFSPAARDRGGDAGRPGSARGQARADGAPRRGGPAPRPRARPALRRPHDGGPGRGHQPHRRDPAARPQPPQQGGQLRRHRGGRRAGRGRDRGRDLADAHRPRAAAQPRAPSAGPMRALAIFGPTAVGKTGVAIEVADLLRERGEDPVAISCDSIQVYRGLEILSGAADARTSGAPRAPAARDRRRRRGVLGRAGSRSWRTPRSTRCSPRDGGRSSSAGPASTCAPRSSELELRPPVPSAVRAEVEADLAGAAPRRCTPSSRRSSPRACIPNDRKRIVRLTELTPPRDRRRTRPRSGCGASACACRRCWSG